MGERRAAPVLRILSRSRAEWYVPQSPGEEVCISVTTPGDPRAPANLSHLFADVLRLSVVDCDEPPVILPAGYNGGWLTPEQAGARGDKVFNALDAVAVLNFARLHGDAPVIVVHCDAGWSRSPGIALGLADVLWPGALDAAEWPDHNRHIRRLLNEAAALEVSHG